MSPAASIVLVTKNRKDDLRRALRSALTQENVPLEVLVIDDGSTDGTAAMVVAEFPSVHLEPRNESRGYIVRRNEAARMASAPVIFSLDDDAAFSSPHVVEITLKDFDHPQIGAVAIPFVNVLQSPEVLQKAPEPTGRHLAVDFIGTAHALKRDLFLQLGGYREALVHQGEERDFCLRLLATGSVVRLGSADPILHYESPKRDTRRMDYYGRRNDVLFAWWNVPWPDLPIHLAATTFNGLRYAVSRARHPLTMVAGLLCGFADGFRLRHARRPVSRRVYRLHRSLKSGKVSRLEQVLPFLLALAAKRL